MVPLLLLGLLSSCAVYDTIFHPHRLPTPKMDAATKAKVRAAEKARHKGTSLKAAEPSTNATDTGGDPAAPSASPAAADDKKKTMSYGDLPEGTRIKYDKQGLVKKTMLDRMANNGHKLHHYDTRPLTPREASRENRKLRKKGHTDHGKGAPALRDKAKDEPLNPALDLGPDPGPPATTPTAPTEPAPPKAKASKKEARPAPTQPAPAPPKAKTKASKAPVPKPDPTQPAP